MNFSTLFLFCASCKWVMRYFCKASVQPNLILNLNSNCKKIPLSSTPNVCPFASLQSPNICPFNPPPPTESPPDWNPHWTPLPHWTPPFVPLPLPTEPPPPPPPPLNWTPLPPLNLPPPRDPPEHLPSTRTPLPPDHPTPHLITPSSLLPLPTGTTTITALIWTNSPLCTHLNQLPPSPTFAIPSLEPPLPLPLEPTHQSFQWMIYQNCWKEQNIKVRHKKN